MVNQIFDKSFFRINRISVNQKPMYCTYYILYNTNIIYIMYYIILILHIMYYIILIYIYIVFYNLSIILIFLLFFD